jgi:hypothetical protein
MRVIPSRRLKTLSLPLAQDLWRVCMYLLTIKDGLVTRHVGPYPSTKQASDDLDRVLATCSERARWQIHALECPRAMTAVAS